MTNLLNNVVAKLSIALVAVAMVFSISYAPASAQTAGELQQMINDLLAQIATLQAQIGGGAVAANSCVSIPDPLTMGAQNANVTALQNFLIGAGQSIPAGATGYFGSQTQGALAGWQAANGVAPAVGYYGPITRAAMDAQCVPVVVAPADDSADDSADDTENDVILGGEASLDDVTSDSASDDNIEEGSEDAELAVFTTTFVDGDASISRIDVALTNSTAGADAWNAFDTVSLWVDGDKVAEEDANSRNDYLGDEDNGIIRFSGLDVVSLEDEDTDITVSATIQDGLDTEELSTWTVGLDGLRFFDGTDVANTESGTLVTANTENFTLETAGTDDELLVKSSSDDPNATTFELEDNRRSSWDTIFAFDLDSRDSTNDISLNQVEVTIIVSSSTFDGLVNDYELVIDGVSIDKLADNNGATAGKYTDGSTTTLLFDVDYDVVIDAGDRIEAELNLRFNSLAVGDEGTTIQGKVTPADTAAIDADGADTLSGTQLAGTATGDVHTLRTSGIDSDMTSSSANQVTDANDTNKNYGNYVIDLTVTAFGEDAWIPLTSARDASSTVGVAYEIEDSNGVSIAGTGTTTQSLQRVSGGTVEGNYVHVSEGDSANFRLTATFDTATAGQYRAQVLTVGFNDVSAAVPTSTDSALPEEDFETANILIST